MASDDLYSQLMTADDHGRYTASMSITFLNKWLLAGERFGFPF
jgi:hypothetical protein